MSELWDFTRISVTQNNLQELKEVAARIKQKGGSKCIPWKSLRDLILVHPNTKKRVNVLALSIYRLVIFPKVLGHIDDVVSDLLTSLTKRSLIEYSSRTTLY
ncbi:hypothetical protein Gogos_003398 [Gossypium gossypioides]|uniref:Uncharacterized protein n=1 Tax=Gossypium gossypioides TaxID=34282 RepID=A0A7J9CMF8_GOSGO|nr:hypothetical protein [Gossypium gossypioides]